MVSFCTTHAICAQINWRTTSAFCFPNSSLNSDQECWQFMKVLVWCFAIDGNLKCDGCHTTLLHYQGDNLNVVHKSQATICHKITKDRTR